MNAAIYARFSSDKQNEESIDAQVRICKEYAENNGFLVTHIYADEAVSGKGSETQKRAQYLQLLKDCEKGKYSTVLIHKYDRISRSLEEHVLIEKRFREWGVELIAVGQNFGHSNESKIMKALMWTLSEYYNDNLASETRKGLKEIALKGEFTGGVPPFGYDVENKKLVINETEAHFVREIFNATLENRGYKNILEQMKAMGITGKRGKDIKYTQVYEILRNEKYTGTFLYSPTEEKSREERRTKPNAIRIENAFPAIIEKKEFDMVQAMLKTRTRRGQDKEPYLCSGLVVCSCGAKMHVYTSSGVPYYRCSQHCGAPGIKVEYVDRAVKKYLSDLLEEKNIRMITDKLREYKRKTSREYKEFDNEIKRKIAEKIKQMENLRENMTKTVLDFNTIKFLTERMHELENEIEVLKNATPEDDNTAEMVAGWLNDIQHNPTAKAVRLLVKNVVVKEKTLVEVVSTLNQGWKIGCGGSQHCLPPILFGQICEIPSGNQRR